MTKNIKDKVWKLYYEGKYIHEIAHICNLSEWEVIQILGLD